MQANTRKVGRRSLQLCAAGAAAVLAAAAFRLLPESSPVARGAADAYGRQCLQCHGKTGPGVPDDMTIDCAARSGSRIHEAYPGRCRDLLAYFAAVRIKRTFDRRAAAPNPGRLMQGECVARTYSCFRCHGELGQGGFRNARSVKGYIPGYFGKDFARLTRGGQAESVRAWISSGVDPALLERPVEGKITALFLQRQAVHMPAFDTLPKSTLSLLTDYVIMLSRFGAMDATDLRTYSRLSERPARTRPGRQHALTGASIRTVTDDRTSITTETFQ